MPITPSYSSRQLDSKILAHRNKLLGLWAAERMGMMGETAAEYAVSLVVSAADKSQNDAALVRKICADMSARGYPIAEDDVRRQLASCARDARADCA